MSSAGDLPTRGSELRGGVRLVVVVIPARNERALIGACLSSVAYARAELAVVDPAVVVRVVAVLDSCTDDTAAVIDPTEPVDVVTVQVGQVGAARAAGVAHALSGVPAGDWGQVWIANTDADSTVPPNWLTSMVGDADSGVDVIVGTVRPAPGQLDPARERAWYAAHNLTDDHRHVHGANLGIRADAYRDVGGFAALATGEDEDLIARCDTGQFAIHRSAAAPVTTSCRENGRVPHGFATYLHQLEPSSLTEQLG